MLRSASIPVRQITTPQNAVIATAITTSSPVRKRGPKTPARKSAAIWARVRWTRASGAKISPTM